MINKITLSTITLLLTLSMSCNNDDDINILIDVPECVAKHIKDNKNSLVAVGKWELDGSDYYNCVRSAHGVIYNHYVINAECNLYCDVLDTLSVCTQFLNDAVLETTVWEK